MGLSYDLISEFVKITNDKKENMKEGIVYATIVNGSGGKYVKIDGSDLLTPMDTTTDIEDGERVTLMIKDHKAIVTGNVTTPSASTAKVDKVTETVNSVSDRVGTFELIVADKVSTNELEAYKATIEVLIAGKATIEDLTATNAKIENLEVKHAEIEDLVADKATIEDLEAVNAVIENLKVKDAEIENAVIDNLEATTAEIKILNADFAQIKTLVNGNLTSDNILSFNLTSEKVTVEDAFIKDAMIDNISAAKINAGKINTNSVSIGSEDGGMLITGSTQQFTDKNGNVRIQIGRDASGDFTFALYGEDGQGQLINQNGITASAIADGLIVNDMVSNDAAISGGKLDISSVITEINNDNSTTIKSNKIYLDEQNQSLEVAFKSLKTQVDTIKDIDSDLTTITDKIQSNTSKIEANKSSISTLLAEDAAIKKQVTDLEGNVVETTNTLTSKYTTLQQNLDGFKTTVNNTYATKTSVNDVKNNLSSNYSTTSAMNSAINQKVDEITASVSSTYATKNEVKTIDDNIKANYSTTEQMESAISVAKNEINLGISQIYETKTEVSNKVGDAINDIQVGGMNLAYDTNKGATGWGWGIQTNSGNTITGETINGVNCVKFTKDSTSGSGWNYVGYGRFKRDKITPSTTYVVSFEMKSNLSFNVASVNLMNGDSSNSLLKTITAVQNKVVANSTAWNKIIFKLTTTDTLSTSTAQVIYITGIPYSANATHYIRNLKLEVGNKATQWSPAPEDITTDINTAKNDAITSANNTLTSTISNYYTKTQTDSQISVAKEEINLGVSSTYETKTNVESKISSSASSTLTSAKSYADSQIKIAKDSIELGVSQKYETKSNVTSQVSTALTSAKSYADTKKSEAISSANNTLNSTIANYYTKAQTDSAIKVAKDEINLGVSSTYETKTNVASQVTSTLNSAKSYADTKKTEAINTASTDATNKANNAKNEAINSANNTLTTTIANYYTKAQTDSQINVAKNAITSSVSSTYETKAEVTNKINGIKIGGRNLIKKKSEFMYGYIGQSNGSLNNTGSSLNSNQDFYTNEYFPLKTGESVCFTSYPKQTVNSSIKAAVYIHVYDSSKVWQKAIYHDTNTANATANKIYTATEDCYVRFCSRGFNDYNHMAEYATKPSQWSPAPEDVETTVSTIEQRVSTAESKITDTAITNTVKKNFYTKAETENAITSKGYATQSQLQQTANDFQFKFTQSGGYNLVRNGNPKPNNYNHWWVSGNGWWYLGNKYDIGIGTTDVNEAYAGSAVFKVQKNCAYSFSCWLFAEQNTKGADVYFIGSSKDDGSYEQTTHLFTGGKNGWTKVEATFTTGSNIEYGFIRIDNNGASNTSGYNVVFFSEVQVVKGSNCYPQWSPNPNEVYDGITTIDKDGIKVSASNINGYTHMTSLGFFVNKGGKDLVSVDGSGLRLLDAKIQLTHANGNKYFLLDENGIIMYNPANGTHQWGKVAAINSKFTVASNGNSSGLSLGHHVNENYVEDILCDSNGVVSVQRQINHNGVFYNNYGQMFVRQPGQGGWEITGRSDSQAIKPGGANQGAIGSNTQYINQSWIANRYNPSSLKLKHLSHYIDDLECLKLVNDVKPARYFYKEYNENGDDVTTFTSRTSQLGLIYEDVRACSGRDLITNEEDAAINLYGMVSVLWGAVRNLNNRLNDVEYENVTLKNELEEVKNMLNKS